MIHALCWFPRRGDDAQHEAEEPGINIYSSHLHWECRLHRAALGGLTVTSSE